MRTLWITAAWAIPLGIAWWWRPRRRPDPAGWLLLLAFAALGGWALWFGPYGFGAEPAAFERWKPTVLYWMLAALAIVAPLAGWDYPARLIAGPYFSLASREWRLINAVFAGLYAVLGATNLLVFSLVSYQDWVGFKYSCQISLLILILFRLNFVWLQILADISVHAWRGARTAYGYLARLF